MRDARPLDAIEWVTAPVRFAAREDMDLDRLKAIVADPGQAEVNRNRIAMDCGWLIRLATGRPILLSRLELGGVTALHLPGETFVEYQLDAQKLRPDTLLATASYGDDGPWYIPLNAPSPREDTSRPSRSRARKPNPCIAP